MAKFITLSNGVIMPTIGLGTWQSTPGEVENALRIALNNGYRSIDTAAVYQNEAEIGAVLKEFLESGKLKRSDLFITTKLMWTFAGPEYVEAHLRDSLKRLQLDYVDLYLIHMPVVYNETFTEATDVKVTDIWKGMELVYEKKLARAIGVSNFNAEQVERIQKMAKVPIHNNQVELHLYFNQKALHEICAKHNISVTAYAPIGSPGRTPITLPNGTFINFDASDADLDNQTVLRLAKKYGKTPAQMLLRHLVQQGIAVIPKSTNEKRIKENNQIFDFALTEEEVIELNNVPQGKRLFAIETMAGHPEDPWANERGKQ